MACLRPAAALLGSVVVLGASGCGSAVFACSTDAQCDGEGAACEADGWCSFPDGDCASGRRYGAHSGGGLGGVCVPADAMEMTSSGTSTSTSAGPLSESSVGSDTTGYPMSETIGVLDSSSTGVPDEPTTSGEASSTGAADEVPPVAWYTFDDAQDLYADASGNALHAWCGEPECPVWVEGIVGNGAIRVDGIEDHLHVDQVPALAITDELTIAVWASVNAPAPGNQEFRSIFAKPIGAATLNTWQIGVDARGQLCGGGGNASEQRGACAAVEEPVGVWHHIALTWSGDQLTLYVDGIARDSNNTVDLEYDDIGVMIGADVNNGEDAAFFEGSIDDARIYDRVLDEDAILALFELAR